MELDAILTTAREALKGRRWQLARERFLEARTLGPMRAQDVYSLGDATWWLGAWREAQALYEESHGLYLGEELPRRAAFAALAVAGSCFMRGEAAVGSGWMGRVMRLLENEGPCAEAGYIVFLEASGALYAGDFAGAAEKARGLQAVARQFNEANLLALGVMCEGQALLRQGLVAEGLRLMDEAMLAAVKDEIGPEWAGNIYCQMMSVCHELADVQRAREWTRATMDWCESSSSPGPFMGVCRVHRAQLFHLEGDWAQAETEATRVCDELWDFDLATVAEARYQLGEVRRLRGDFDAADESYRLAHASGRDPQPGLALLHLSRGRAAEALASIQTSLAGSNDPLRRAALCGACVEVAIAAGQTELAREAADELTACAARYATSGLRAAAEQAQGLVLLHEGQHHQALQTLREACLHWQQLGAPYDTACVRVALARAYEAIEDRAAAALELAAAQQVFASLGALPDLAALQPQRAQASAGASLLTPREREVLVLLSEGQSNRGIALALTISEKTVARHLSNLYAKLDVSSRTEAARYAFDTGLVGARG